MKPVYRGDSSEVVAVLRCTMKPVYRGVSLGPTRSGCYTEVYNEACV